MIDRGVVSWQLCSVLKILSRSRVSEQAILFFLRYFNHPNGLHNPFLNVPKHFLFTAQINK